MIKHINYKVLALFLVFSLSSCNKWLDLKPQDGLVREDYWQTKEQLESSVIGIYASLLNGQLVSNMLLWGELRADMIETTQFARSQEVLFSNAEILPDNYLVNWAPIYSTINYCNTVIEFGPSVMNRDKTLTQQELNGYLAEARGIRALMYFYLLRIWGEVPLQLKASSSDSKVEQLPKSSKEQVAAQILEDLNFAALNARATYGTPAMNKGRLTIYGVNAIQADVYLWLDQYENAIAACDKVINSNRFGLISGANAPLWYNTVFVNGNSNESIFELQFDQQAFNPWFLMLADVNRRFIASPTVGEKVFGIDDFDPINVKDIRGDGASFRSTDNTLFKLVGLPGDRLVAENSSYRHWFLYRYSDILLLKAEALAWVDRGAEALELVETIRTRAQALEITSESPDPGSPAEVSDYILRERAREFAFEGKRWFDLLRNAKRNNYERINVITDVIAEIAPPDKQQSMISKYMDPRSHYLPIHFSELQADKLLEQNPFYK